MIPLKIKERFAEHYKDKDVFNKRVKIAVYDNFIIVMSPSLSFSIYIHDTFEDAIRTIKRNDKHVCIQLTVLKNHTGNQPVLYSDLLNGVVGEVKTVEDIILLLMMTPDYDF